MPAKTPRQRRKLRTREAILEAAADLVAEEGADRLSVRKLASRIDYSAAGLYEYFESKDAIIDAMCEQANERLLQHLRAVPDDLPPAEQLVELGLAYIRFARQSPHLFRLMFDRLRPDIERPPEQDEFDPDDSLLVVYQAIQRGLQAGVLQLEAGVAPFSIAYSLWTVAHGAATLQTSYLSELHYDYAAADRRTLTLFVGALCKPA